jgi:hypothetical protein
VCPNSTPPPHIYRGVQGVSRLQSREVMQHRLLEFTRSRHEEAGGEGGQWQFSQTRGSADPWSPPFARRLVSGTLCRFWLARSFLRQFTLVVGPWILVLAPDSPERYCLGLGMCFLSLEVCLDCHVNPSILVPTLKYLILGCECLLQCVYPSLVFFENFLDFSGDYSLFP